MALFGDYTKTNEDRILQIVRRVNDLTLECRNITSDKTLVTVEVNGVKTRRTVEEKYFIDKTNEFRRRLRNGETIDDIMVEALAIVREAIQRRLNMFPYDVQIEAAVSMLGTLVDGENRDRVVAEMKTGEGKTLVQILVAYLNVLEATKDEDRSKWSSVHIITSNDALAKRDQQGNNPVFELLGLTSGFVPSRKMTRTTDAAQRNINKHKKIEAYKSDIVYATPTTIAFDYLEDNTIYDVNDRRIRRRPGFAIVDEADDILIDQATVPLRLSSSPSLSGDLDDREIIQNDIEMKKIYKWATEFLYGKSRRRPLVGTIFDQSFGHRDERVTRDYNFMKDSRDVMLSDEIEEEIGRDLTDSSQGQAIYNWRLFALIKCIIAKEAYTEGVDYTIKQNGDTASVILIDTNIGRNKESSKYTRGMQDAIEAKEEFLEQDSKTAKKRYHIDFSTQKRVKAMFTYPDFLTIYDHHVSGMTGTSDEKEFRDLYGFETYRVRTRKRNIRIDADPVVYATLLEKYQAIIEEVIRVSSTGQPVLIGTTSVLESETISSLLKENFVRHQLLNAKNEEEENEIIACAGQYGTVTVATNMAGRGTDIKLGPGVRELGGLYVIGTSRNKSSRIDRQLMGRAGRQGDPGRTIYFASLQDELVRECYKGKAIDGIIKIFEGTGKPIKNKTIVNQILESQSLRESKDKKSRIDNEKFNKSFKFQRKHIYEDRNKVLDSNILEFMQMIKTIISKYADILVNEYSVEDITSLIGHLVPVKELYSLNKSTFKTNIFNALFGKLKANFDMKRINNAEVKKYVDLTKIKFLEVIDSYWLSHIEYLEDLRFTLSLNIVDDPFKEFDDASMDAFHKFLIPSMYNEMITYALNPTLKYGYYTIKQPGEEEEEGKIL